MNKGLIAQIINSELELATGCTEPAAIAYTASVAAKHLQDEINKITVLASGNMIKNAMAAGIPGTPFTGIEYASALGAVGGNPDLLLEVASQLTEADYQKAKELVESKQVSADVINNGEKLYVDVTLFSDNGSSRAVINGGHTNIVLIEENGKAVFTQDAGVSGGPITPELIANELSVKTVYDYVMEMTADEVPEMILKAIEINSYICEMGLKNEYGLQVGRVTRKNMENNLLGSNMVANAVMVTAAGSDARMAGAPFSVVANSGSGNQGITATMPIVATAKWLGVDRETMLKAVTLSNLVPIYIKSKFGRLSALCGATVASTGAACGLTYLLGGTTYEHVCYAIQNMIGNVTGMLCDGAKADCALKIATCVNAAFQAAMLAMENMCVQQTDGIVEADVEKSIDNFTMLGNNGSKLMDEIVLRMMLDKQK